jgi:hypothetical protein
MNIILTIGIILAAVTGILSILLCLIALLVKDYERVTIAIKIIIFCLILSTMGMKVGGLI